MGRMFTGLSFCEAIDLHLAGAHEPIRQPITEKRPVPQPKPLSECRARGDRTFVTQRSARPHRAPGWCKLPCSLSMIYSMRRHRSAAGYRFKSVSCLVLWCVMLVFALQNPLTRLFITLAMQNTGQMR